MAIILLMIIIVVSIIGIVSAFKATNGYENLSCASGIVLDDLINGNVSFYGDSIFFTGIRTLDTQLRNLNAKISSLNT